MSFRDPSANFHQREHHSRKQLEALNEINKSIKELNQTLAGINQWCQHNFDLSTLVHMVNIK